MIHAHRVDVRSIGSVAGHGEVGVRFEVVLATAEEVDTEEFGEEVVEIVRGGLGALVVRVERPAAVEFTVGGWTYRTFLLPEVADETVRELRLPAPVRLVPATGPANRVVYATARVTAEALADYLADVAVRNDPRIVGASRSRTQVREREGAMRRTAAHIRMAAAWRPV